MQQKTSVLKLLTILNFIKLRMMVREGSVQNLNRGPFDLKEKKKKQNEKILLTHDDNKDLRMYKLLQRKDKIETRF